mgnify:FL=1
MSRRFLLGIIVPLLAMGALGCQSSPEAPSSTPPTSIDGVGEPSWVEGTTVYEVFIPDASEEGTFRGLIGRLDEIQDMGVNTLWLMPIHPIGEERRKDDIGPLGSPYSIQDYYDVNPNYGTKEDFQALVDSVHARDMHIIIDLVANHTAWDHPWLEDHPDMYTDGPINGFTVPVLNGDTTDWTDVVELDFDNPRTRQEMIDIMQYWVREFNIDGYRCDVAHAVPLDFWENAIDSVETHKEVFMLAEAAEPEMHEVGFDQTYAWPFYGALKRVWEQDAPVHTLATQVDTTLSNLPGAGERLRFTTNHDETMWDAPPPALFGGLEGSQAAFVLATSMPGAPLVYNGQELGVTDSVSFFDRTPYDWAQDPPIRTFYRDYLTFYRNSPALQRGDLTVRTPKAEDVLIYERATDEQTVVIAVNVRDVLTQVRVPDAYDQETLTDVRTGESVGGKALTMDAYDYRILRVEE